MLHCAAPTRRRGSRDSHETESEVDEFQATPPEELERLRLRAMDRFGAMVLTEALKKLASEEGTGALGGFMEAMAHRIEETEDDERVKQLAIEQLTRIVNAVREEFS